MEIYQQCSVVDPIGGVKDFSISEVHWMNCICALIRYLLHLSKYTSLRSPGE